MKSRRVVMFILPCVDTRLSRGVVVAPGLTDLGLPARHRRTKMTAVRHDIALQQNTVHAVRRNMGRERPVSPRSALAINWQPQHDRGCAVQQKWRAAVGA